MARLTKISAFALFLLGVLPQAVALTAPVAQEARANAKGTAAGRPYMKQRGKRHNSVAVRLLKDIFGPGQTATKPLRAHKARRAHAKELPQWHSSLIVTADALQAVGEREFNPFQAPAGQLILQDPAVPAVVVEQSDGLNHDDILDTPRITNATTYRTVRETAKQDWIVLGACTLGFITVELIFFRHLENTARAHIFGLMTWFVFAAGFNVYIYFSHGPADAFDWASGYALEWMLSVDNLFVFHVVFNSYKMPEGQVRKALFVGIASAVIARLVFFGVVSSLISVFQWIRVPFGLLLVWSGIETARAEDDDDEDLSDTRLVRMVRSCLGSRLHEGYDEEGHGMFMVDESGRVKATMLFLVVLCLEVSDILFAVDSVSAKVAQIPDQYMAFSSSVLAMFGLRAMFFIVSDLVDVFSMLKYGLCVILVFIGVELILAPIMRLASSTVLVLILSVFALSMIASIAMDARIAVAEQQGAERESQKWRSEESCSPEISPETVSKPEAGSAEPEAGSEAKVN